MKQQPQETSPQHPGVVRLHVNAFYFSTTARLVTSPTWGPHLHVNRPLNWSIQKKTNSCIRSMPMCYTCYKNPLSLCFPLTFKSVESKDRLFTSNPNDGFTSRGFSIRGLTLIIKINIQIKISAKLKMAQSMVLSSNG